MPVVEIKFHMPGRTPSDRTYVALVDSGSDGTLVPIDILEGLGARYVGDAIIRWLWGVSNPVDIYLVSVIVGPQTVHGVRVIAVPEDSEIILGRNVLNHLIVTLNGLAGVTEIVT
jgi:predicted aspartyl protease